MVCSFVYKVKQDNPKDKVLSANRNEQVIVVNYAILVLEI